jgi:hypothetical protein
LGELCQAWTVKPKLSIYGFEVGYGITANGGCIQHVQKKASALNVPEKLMAKPCAAVGTFDKAW